MNVTHTYDAAYSVFSYWYLYGFRTRAAAVDAALEAMANGELSPGESPIVAAYRNNNGEWRFGVRLSAA